MNTIISKIGMGGGKTLVSLFSGIAKAARGAALPLLVAASAILPARGDGLALMPAELPHAMQQVSYNQTLTATNISGIINYDNWKLVSWNVETAPNSYAVGANETPLWEGAQSFRTNILFKLPIAFPYRGKIYDSIQLNTGGQFYLREGNYYTPFDRSPSYSSLKYCDIGISPLWLTRNQLVEVWVDSSVDGEVSFRFAGTYTYNDAACSFAYRVTLKRDGTIRFAYRQGDDLGGAARVIGISAYGNNYESLPAAEDETGIPAVDYVFSTYGLPDGFSLSTKDYNYSLGGYYNYQIYGKTDTPCQSKFAISVKDGEGNCVTNIYDFIVVENPDRPPVIDAFTPADTNVVRMLTIGQTLDFHIDASDPVGGAFDVKWKFAAADSSYDIQSGIELGSGPDLTFVATKELYEAQSRYGSSILICTVSDEFWSKSVSWRVYIRRDTYIDPAADPTEADGSAAYPLATFAPSAIKKGDTVILAPGTYNVNSWSDTPAVTIRSSGNRDNTRIVVSTSTPIRGSSSSERAVIRNVTIEGSSGIVNANLYDCTVTGADSNGSLFNQANLYGCYVHGNFADNSLFRYSSIVDCTVAGNVIDIYDSEDTYHYYYALGYNCTLERSIVVNNLTLDGVERNWWPDSGNVSSATDCCSIPAMTNLGEGNIGAQPLFVSVEEGDLRLRAGSPCLADDPADNIGAYKEAGVEGFVVHAFTDPVRGILSNESELQIVAAGGTAYVTVKPLTDRAFLGWVTNGVAVAGEPSMELAIENIDCDYEVEALFEVREIYVSPAGDDGNDGLSDNPIATIAKAAELALEGETIILAEGSYAPAILSETFATDNRRLMFVGAGAGRTFIDGGGTNRCLQLGPNMTLKGASIINGYQSNGRCASGVTGGTIENCIVSNCVARANTTAAGAYDTTIISSLVANNTNTASSAYYAGGCYSCCIYNSTIANNSISGYGTGGAVECVLVNNVIWGNTNEDPSYYNNENFYRTWNNPRHGSILNGDSVGKSNMVGGGDWFADASAGDYRLVCGSPAIDAGANIDEISYDGATDLAGNPRIKNGVVDYGAYEGGVATAAPAAPEATATNAKAAKGIPLSWSSVRNAVEYRIYRATSADGAQTLVGTTTGTSFRDMTVEGDTGYFYWVAGYADETFGEGAKFGPIAVRALPDLRIETTSLPAATEVVPYSVQLACYGNMGDVTWSLPDTVVTRGEGSTFNGDVGVVIGDDWPELSDSWQDNPVITLPFSFTWFGVAYDKVTISKFGGLYFGRNDNYLSWSSYGIDEYPKIAVNEGPYTSSYYVEATERRVDSQPDHVTIVWKGKCDGKTVEFSATLNSDNTVRLAYGVNKPGAYVAFSNGSDDTVTTVQPRLREDCSNMDDILITCLPNESHLVISEGGLLSGIEDDAGSYKVSALVEDSANGDVAYKTFTLTVNANANTRPVIDATTPDEGSMVIPQGDSQTFAVTAHDPESAALSYKWYLDDELVSSGASYTFTASSIGYHTLVCDVADALWTNGQVYAEWEIHVGSKIYVDAASTAAEPDGTQAAPYKTIMSALNSAGNGDTILVAPGTYGQTYLSGGWYSGGPTIVVRSTGSAADTFIDGNGERPCVANYCYHDGLTFIGFTLKNGHADYEWTPTRGGGGSFMVNLKNCAVYNCTAEGAGGGVFGATIDHCTVFGCTAGTGGGIDSNSTAIASIVWANTATNAGASASANYEAGAQFAASCSYPLPEGTDNIADDPMLADASSGDWRLLVGSPCLLPRMGCYDGDGITEGDIGTSYTVTFDANGGECATATRKVGEGQPIGALPSATRAGYTFDGWYTAKTEGFKVSESYEVTKDQTLYARWTETVYFTVTFDANGGTCEEASRSVQSGTAIGALPSATRAGYTFAGWYTDKSGGTQVIASTPITKNTTIYVRWTEIPTYTVTFDANGGTCDETSRKVEQRTAVGELPEATWTSHSFDGWFTAKDGGSQFFATNAVTANITLYAHWTEIYELTIEDGVLTGFTGALPKTLAIPSSVTAFGADLFKGEKNLTTVTGGRNVTKCGAGAFRDTGLWDAAPNGPVVVCGVLVGYKGTVPETLILAEGVKVIADGALAGVSTLRTVYLPSSIAVIGAGAFAGSANLDDVYGLENATDVAADAFEDTLYATFRLKIAKNNGRKSVIGFKGPCPGEVVIPDDISAIGGGAFISQRGLTNITLSPNIEIIGTNAFSGCTGLTSVELPEKLEFIAERAFRGCTGLTAVNLPASLKTIEESAFRDCSALATVTGGENVSCLRTSAFDGTAWYDAPVEGEECVELVIGSVLLKVKGLVPASYEISSNVTMVASGAFAGVTTLTDLYIGTEVVSLWDRAFAGCTSLGSVTVPAGCCEFGDYLFDGCSSLTNVFFRGHAPTNSVPHVFAGTPENLTVRIKEGSRGWLKPGSDERPKYWPVNGQPAREVWQPEEVIGVMSSRIIDGTITNRTTLTGGSVYEIHSYLVIASGARLTIEAGAILKFANQRNLYVHGELFTRGTKENPVVFTSIKDDTYGGDTNGDGARSNPNPGDWNDIWIYSGKADFQYTDLLYSGGAGNERGVIAVNGGNLSMTGCTIAHSGQDGVWNWDGSIAATNCVFTDLGWATAPYRGSLNEFVNCVFYDVNVAVCYWSHWSGRPVFRNCIFAKCMEGWCELANRSYGDPPANWGVTVANSVFWNDPSDPGLHSCGLAGKDGNIYANPLLIDPENWDFRISPESPCVDAGDGTVAPEYDYYGQPRMDVKFARNTGTPTAEGVYPDIGIYEVPGSTTRLLPNLEVIEIASAPASVAPGETLTVTYTVKNAGDAAAKGTIRDTVRIKSAANGGTLAVGTVTQSYNLEPDGSSALVATVTMPAAPAGDWYVGVDVNPNRDVYEQNMQKNSLWTEDAIEVTLPNLAVGGSTSVSVASGATKGYILADVPAEGGVVVITGVASSENAIPVIARVATGHMPTAAMNDATSFVRADGAVVLVVPSHADGDTVYLAIENTGIEDLTLNSQLTTLTTELWAVYPEIAANVGDMGFTFTGSGLNADSEFYLGNIKAKSVSVIDSANVYAVFDVQNIPADIYYSVSADGKTLKNAVYINKKAKGPILEAKLDLPERTRDNRVYTGYVVYENKGDTQMNAPMFVVTRGEGDTVTMLGAADGGRGATALPGDGLTSNAVVIAGLGSTHPAGILKPGDSGRLPFKFKPVGSYNLSLKKRVTTADDVAEMATRLNLRGCTDWDGNDIYYSALNVRNGNPVAGVSGWLLDSRTREPLEGVSLRIVSTNTVATSTTGAAWDGDGEEVDGEVEVPVAAGSTLKTDANGYFQFALLEDGVYRIESADKSRIVSDVIVEVADQKDVNGLEVMALPAGRIYGYVYDDSGAPVAYATLSLGIDDAKSMVTTRTDGFGAYSFDGLWDGNYAVEAERSGVIGAGSVDGIEINATNLTARADLVLPVRAMVTGTVTCGGVPLTFGSVRVTEIGEALDEGEMSDQREMAQHVVEVDTNGQWTAEGVLPGRCRFAFEADGYATSSNDLEKVWQIQPGEGNVVGIEAVPAPIFKVLLATGFIDESKGEKFKTAFCATEEDTNVVSYAWHIFSDGDAVGQSITTTNDTIVCEFERVGQYHATLTETLVDGTTRTSTIGNVVEVREAIETKYRENAIILSAEQRHNAGTLQYVDADVNADGTEAEPGTRLRLTGAADIPLDGAVIMFGFESEDEEGEVSVEGGIRRVVSYTTDGETITCVTEAASLYDVYAQFAEAKLFEVGGEEETQGGASLHAARPRLLNAPTPVTRGAKGAAKKVGEFANSLFRKSSEMTRKMSAHAVNGLKLIGEGTPTGIGCRIHEVSNKAIYLHKIYVDVRDYDLERMEPDMSMSQGVGGFRLVRIKASYTNNVCQQTCRVKVDFEPYVTVDGQIAAGWEKRTDKCEVKIGKPFAVKVGVVPLGRWQFIAQLRPYLNGNLRGKVDLGIRFKGRCDYTANFVDGRIFWTDPEFSIDKVSMIAYPTIRNIKIHGGGLDAGMGGAFGIRLESISFLDLVAGLEAQARFSITKDVGVPTTMEMGASVNAILECQLKDTTFFGHVMARCPLFKLSASLWNLCGWRWTAARSQFDWYQDFSAKGKRRIVYENWSDRAIKEELTRKHFLVGFSEWRTTQTYPFNKFRWRFGDNEPIREYAGSGQNAPTDIRCDYKKAGKYNVWLDAYSGPADFAGDSCTKEVTVEENPEDENEEQKEESVDNKGASTQQSVDPNEMAGPEGVGGERFVKPGQEMTYTIYFENKADAAIAAQEVFVENKLSDYLDWSTFEMKTVSLGGQIDNGLDGFTAADIAALGGVASCEMDQTNGLYKTCSEVRFDAATGVASWYIRVLDPAKRAAGDGECWPDDPDAGVLQPNVNSPEGEGYIIYSVKVREDAPANMMINNSASIVFDKNPAIVTDPAWWNTVAKVARVQVEGDVTDLELIVGLPYGDALPPAPAAQPGYTFGGWWTAPGGPNGTGRCVKAQDNVEAGDSGLYAYWLANAYTVHFEPNGGTGVMSDQPLVFDTPDVLDPNAFTKKYYAFDGWATNETGTAVYADCAEVVNLTSVSNGVVTLYATWRWNAVEVAFDAQGATPVPTNRLYEVGAPYGELPEIARAGFVFAGWYDGQSGTSNRVKEQDVARADVTKLYARWLKRGYTVRYNANGGSGVMSDQAFEFDNPATLDANAFSKRNYVFAGWATTATGDAVYADCAEVVNLTTDNGGVVTLYATWKFIPQPEPTPGPTVEPTPAPVAAETPRLWTEVTDTVPTVAALYEGYLCDGAGNVKGTIQVKVGKPGKKDGLAAVSAVVVGLDGKKTKLKAAEKGKAMLAADGPTTVSLAGGDACEVTLGAKGMGGTYGAYVIDGSLNVFASKDAADKAVAATTLDKWKGAVNVAWRLAGDGSPYQTLSVNIAAKGKAKVAGTLADGTKVSASGQLIVGENWCCVPVVVSKKGVSLQFAVWLPKTATSAALPVVVGLGEDVKVGKPGTLKGGAAFRIDEATLGAVLGKAVLPYLPDGLAVTGGAKWSLPKAGSVTYAKGTTTVDAAKAGENPSGLKLTYKAKDGTFKGSFKAYTDVGGKPKATTVNVTGVLVDGVGYGAATVKKVGGVSVKVE